MMRMLYPGSFDPVTKGHMDIIRRAARLCDELVVAVMHNPAKRGCFPVEERLALIRRAVAHLPNVTVDSWDGLTVAYARKIGADCLVRGLRGAGDFQSESLLAQVNGRLAPGLETVFLLSKPEHMCVSSSVVREAASFGADISTFVPAAILADVEQHFRQGAG